MKDVNSDTPMGKSTLFSGGSRLIPSSYRIAADLRSLVLSPSGNGYEGMARNYLSYWLNRLEVEKIHRTFISNKAEK